MVTRPGGLPPTQPTSTEASFYLDIDTPGSWTVDLYLGYEHEVDGAPWSSWAQKVIEAKSVVADLDPGPEVVTTTETITLNGSDSQISGLAVASATFLLDQTPIDGCDFPGPVTDPAILVCAFPASDLGPGVYAVSLELRDSVGGFTDVDQATIEVIEEPPFVVDFDWVPDGINTKHIEMEIVLSDGWSLTDLQTVIWEFGDGSPQEQVTCGPLNYYCRIWSHDYVTDGYFDITLTATTIEGDIDSATHLVTAGNPPPPPSADFEISPADPSVNTTVSFTFTGSCTGDCTYYWDFGDGLTSALTSPTHSFMTPGEYLITLTVTNSVDNDEASRSLTVTDCWSPTGVITQTGTCYGAPIELTAPPSDAVSWSTGENTTTITVAAPQTYWAHVRQGLACWAYIEHTVTLEQCQGTPEGNVDMDPEELINAMDVQSMIRELSDDDGTLVIDSWAAEIGAPGADLIGASGPDPDGRITADDLNRLLEILFTDN